MCVPAPELCCVTAIPGRRFGCWAFSDDSALFPFSYLGPQIGHWHEARHQQLKATVQEMSDFINSDS